MKAAGAVAFIRFLCREFPFVSGTYRKIPEYPDENDVSSVMQVCVSCSCTKQRFLSPYGGAGKNSSGPGIVN